MNWWMVGCFATWIWAGLGMRHVLQTFARKVPSRMEWALLILWWTWPLARKRG